MTLDSNKQSPNSQDADILKFLRYNKNIKIFMPEKI